jgi:hypothetical protein
MIAVPMMQATAHQIVHMIAMWNLLMLACLMAAGALRWHAAIRVRLCDRDDMLIIVILMRAMQMTIVQIVYVSLMLNAGVSARLAVDMIGVTVRVVFHSVLLVNLR